MIRLETPGERTRGKKLMKAVDKSLSTLKAMGTSKYEKRKQHNKKLRSAAKELGIDPSTLRNEASPYIHSYKTLKTYRKIGRIYARWIAKNDPSVSTLRYALKQGLPRKFIQEYIDKGSSPNTISTYACAIAKLHRVHSWDVHDGKPLRRSAEFTRSRSFSLERFNEDLKKYGLIVELPFLTGVRRETLARLTKECFRERPDGKIFLHLDGKAQNTKNGLSGDVMICDADQDRIREILALYKPGERMCPKIPAQIDVHGIRALYAEKLYLQVAREISAISPCERVLLKHPKYDRRYPSSIRTSAPAIRTRRSDGRQFDRIALFIVSKSLLHNRDDVVAINYLWRHESPFVH